MRRLAALAIGCALITSGTAHAVPYTVDRLLALEELGPVQVDPSQRWLVVQRYDRFDRAPTYDLDFRTRLGLGRVQVFDLMAGGAERRLELPPGAGYTNFGVSPGGRRLAIARLGGHAYELGVVDLQTGKARWLGTTPRQQIWGPSVLWRSDDELLVLARPADFPDVTFGYGFQGFERLVARRDATSRGQSGATVIGSGKHLDLVPTGPSVGLVSIDLKSGRKRVLIPGEVRDMALSPDRRVVAGVVEAEAIQYVLPEPSTSASNPVRKRLTLVDLETGRATTPCESCDPMDRFVSWAPDSRQVLIYARQGAVGYASAGRFWRLAIDGRSEPLDLAGLTPALGETYDTAGVPLAGWLDGVPVVRARKASGGRADYWRIAGAARTNLTADLPGESRAIGADASAWAVATADQVWRVTADGAQSWNVAQSAVTSLAAPQPGFRGSQNFVPPLRDLALTSTAAQPPLPWLGPRLAAPTEGDRVAAQTSTGQVRIAKDLHGVETVVLRRSDQTTRLLATINAGLADVEAASPIAIHHKGADGAALTSWLYLPPGQPRGRHLPVVVLPYPGDSSATSPRVQQPGVLFMSTNAQVLAAHGYAALVPAMPYLAGRDPIEGLAEQILAPVDAAAAEGLVDPERIALWGHSYGGWAVVAAATQSDRFKAIIATAATYNLSAGYGRMGPQQYLVPEAGLTVFASTGWQESGQARLHVPPWKDPALYQRNSPLTYVDRIKAPVAIFHGDNDKGLEQAQDLFGALYRQGKDAILVTYHGEGHTFFSPGNVRDYFARVLGLLDETIGPPQASAGR